MNNKRKNSLASSMPVRQSNEAHVIKVEKPLFRNGSLVGSSSNKLSNSVKLTNSSNFKIGNLKTMKNTNAKAKELLFHSIFKPEEKFDNQSVKSYEDDFTDNDSLNALSNSKARISMEDEKKAAIKIQQWFRKLLSQRNIKIYSNSLKDKTKNNFFDNFNKSKIYKYGFLNYSLGSNLKKAGDSTANEEHNEQFTYEPHQSVANENYDSNNNKTSHDNISSGTLKKYDWLDELEKVTVLTDESSSSYSDINNKEQTKDKQKHQQDDLLLNNKYLTDEKLENVLTYLQGVNNMDVKHNENVEKNSVISSKSHKNYSPALNSSNVTENKSKQKLNEVENAKEQKKSTKKQYEETISRHLAFIDQLISDKKALTEHLAKLQVQIKNITEKFQKEMEAREERHVIELKKLKDIHIAAEQIKREQWIKTEANRIKDLTAKGFEPALQKLISQHKTEINRLKTIHKEELRLCEEHELAKYNAKIEELKKEKFKEIAMARKEEREMSEKEFERKLSEEIEAMNKEKDNLSSEIARERRYMEKQLSKQEEEFKKMQDNLNKSHSSAINVLKREFEAARNEQEKRHESIMDNLGRQHAMEKEEWGREFFKKHQNEFAEKEKELRNMLKLERDKEIDLVLQKLVDEREKEVQQNKIDVNNQIKKLREKHKQELNNLEISEKNAYDNYNEIKRKLFVKESENKTLLSQLSQAEDMIKELNKVICKRNEEKNKLMDIVRQEVADKMASFESENLKLRREIHDLKAKHKVDVENIQLNAQQQMKLKEDEVEEVHRRVKEIIEKRVKIENDLRKERDAAIKRADYIQNTLLEQNKNTKKK